MVKIKDLPKKVKDKYFLNRDKGTVVFEIVNIDRKRGKVPNVGIPGKDIVFDPKTKDSYEIVYKTEQFMNPVTQTMQERPRTIWFDNGLIACNLNTRQGLEMYEYLSMSNYNSSNPFRDRTVPAKFYLVDDVVKAKEELLSEEKIVKAKAYVFNMSTEEMRRMADWLDIIEDKEIDSRKEPQVIQSELLKYAAHQPTKLQEAREIIEERGEYISTVIRCLRHHIIRENKRLERWVWAESNVAILGYDNDISHTQNVLRFARWLEKGENSGKAYEDMLDKLQEHKESYKV